MSDRVCADNLLSCAPGLWCLSYDKKNINIKYASQLIIGNTQGVLSFLDWAGSLSEQITIYIICNRGSSKILKRIWLRERIYCWINTLWPEFNLPFVRSGVQRPIFHFRLWLINECECFQDFECNFKSGRYNFHLEHTQTLNNYKTCKHTTFAAHRHQSLSLKLMFSWLLVFHIFP